MQRLCLKSEELLDIKLRWLTDEGCAYTFQFHILIKRQVFSEINTFDISQLCFRPLNVTACRSWIHPLEYSFKSLPYRPFSTFKTQQTIKVHPSMKARSIPCFMEICWMHNMRLYNRFKVLCSLPHSDFWRVFCWCRQTHLDIRTQVAVQTDILSSNMKLLSRKSWIKHFIYQAASFWPCFTSTEFETVVLRGTL